MFEGKADVLEACRHRKMKVTEKTANLLETQIHADGILDGMDVTVDVNCVAGMPADSHGSITFRGNVTQLMAVLNRVWPGSPELRELLSPRRQSWPDYRGEQKEET